jgi:signal transduction histidine kinase
VAGITCVILFVFSLFLSRWATKPVKAAFEKQQRFVSDASHELATPLTTIGTNADVLEHEIGRNQRLTQIKEQSERMGLLLSNLLTLARSDEKQIATVKAQYDLSATVLSSALEFESRAFEEGRNYSYQIAPDVLATGDEAQTKQLITIFVDNALKHSDPGGEVTVSLTNVVGVPNLRIYNTGAGVAPEDYQRIFDRFYRSDSSRARETGGYGLGLSIAQTIAKAQNISIAVDGKYGSWVAFTLRF